MPRSRDVMERRGGVNSSGVKSNGNGVTSPLAGAGAAWLAPDNVGATPESSADADACVADVAADVDADTAAANAPNTAADLSKDLSNMSGVTMSSPEIEAGTAISRASSNRRRKTDGAVSGCAGAVSGCPADAVIGGCPAGVA